MARHTELVVLIVLGGLLGTFAARPVSGAEVPPGVIPTSELRPGMKGYGLTALTGVEPTRFDVEVLGVLPGWFARGDLVLARVSGPVIDEAGVISGMSGSPVYVDDRLVGAVAYAWSFSKIPLAGVTPAADMLALRHLGAGRAPGPSPETKAVAWQQAKAGRRELLDVVASRRSGGESGARAASAIARMLTPPGFGAGRPAVPWEGLPQAIRNMFPGAAGSDLQPLPMPLALTGSHGGDGPLLSALEGAGFLPAQAPPVAAASSATAGAPVLKPGMPLGVSFVTGDLDVSSMGTVTWVGGQEALAFGHPMFGMGDTDLPACLGQVQAVVPSLARSFKLASAGPIVGRIVQDRTPAALVKLGESAAMFPCTVHVKGAADEQFTYRIAGHWSIAPILTYITLAESAYRWEGESDRFTVDARAEMMLKGRPEPLVLANTYATESPIWPCFDLVVDPMDLLLLNPYEDVEVESVVYDVQIRRGFEAALIESAWADRVKVAPGSEVNVYVRLLPYRGEEVTRKLTLRIPDTAVPGTEVEVLVCDAMTHRMNKWHLDPGLAEPRDFEGIVRMIREDMEPNRNLVLRAAVMEQGLRYAGDAMPSLPPSVLSILAYSEMAGRAAPLATDIVQTEATPWVLEGAQALFLTVGEAEPYER